MIDKNEWCPVHPEYDPNVHSTIPRCSTCEGLSYAAQLIGNFPGECEMCDVHESGITLVLVPTSYVNFGLLRNSFGWWYKMNDEPEANIDPDTCLIYVVDETLSESRLHEYVHEEKWCTVQERSERGKGKNLQYLRRLWKLRHWL